MNDDTVGMLEKAERFIRSARILAQDGDFDSAASRLYYAMFFTAEVLLKALGQSYKSHQGVLSAYGKSFAKTRELDPWYHHMLMTAYTRRQMGDYALSAGLVEADIETMARDAEKFLADARAWLTSHSSLN